MSISKAVPRTASRRRKILFLIAGGLVALALLTASPNVLAPWMVVNIEGLANPAELRWDLALEGGVDVLAVVCLVASLARPAQSALLVQYLLYATVLAAAVIVPFSALFLINVALLLLVPLTYPYRRELFSLKSRHGPSVAMLAVAAVAAAVLLPIAVQALRTQATLLRGHGSDSNVLATNAEHLMLLALAGLLAATRRPGWKVIAFGVAATYAYLAVASMLLPNQPHSWGVAGGVASLLAAAAFGIAATAASRPVGPDAHGSRTGSADAGPLGSARP
jgi:hypothetical protein